MIDLDSRNFRQVKEILHRHLPDRPVWVFGSRINGTAKPHSDLDLAILGTERVATKILSALKEEFAASNLPFRVDIVDWNRISEEFRKIIEKNHLEIG